MDQPLIVHQSGCERVSKREQLETRFPVDNHQGHDLPMTEVIGTAPEVHLFLLQRRRLL
jgi:hypothetical protein